MDNELIKLTKEELIEKVLTMEEEIANLKKERSNFKKGGRPRIDVTKETKEKIDHLYHEKGWGYRKIAQEIGLSHSKIRQIILE